MASLPQRPSATGRTRSSARESSASTTGWYASGTSDHSISSSSESLEGSETVFLNRSSSNKSTSHSPSASTDALVKIGTSSDDEQVTGSAAAAASENPEPRKCWICYMDETEDASLDTEWRSPCPCALTAHEACLLDWLADLENPRNRKRNNSGAKMQCPQCKSEIVISRPRSYVVDAVRAMERLAARLVLPGVVVTIVGTAWAGFYAHGQSSLYLIFGAEDARRLIADQTESPWQPRLNIGLPCIPLALILSRTRFADGLLPVVPVVFFSTQSPSDLEPPGGSLWPPSAAMVFAALPYARSFYHSFYERLFGDLERRWIAEVQPRAGEDNNNNGQQQGTDREAGGLANMGDGQILMEIDLELQLGMGGDEQQDHDIPADVPDVPIDDQQQGAGAGAGQNGQNQAGAGQNPANRDRQILGRHREELIHDTSNLADTIIGALLFPAISASMGGLLKLALPKSWTTPVSTVDRARTGLLQSRWGRSVVGGCLFVLLRDAVVLYCRWKLAQTHRKRRVLNYDKTKKKVVDR